MDRKPRNIYTAFPGGKHKVLTLSYDDGKVADRIQGKSNVSHRFELL